jgi:hypothetical protein
VTTVIRFPLSADVRDSTSFLPLMLTTLLCLCCTVVIRVASTLNIPWAGLLTFFSLFHWCWKNLVLPSFSPRDDRCVASRFFSVNMKVSSQGNLRGRSLKGALATTTVWHSITHLVLSSVYLLVAVHFRVTTFRIL